MSQCLECKDTGTVLVVWDEPGFVGRTGEGPCPACATENDPWRDTVPCSPPEPEPHVVKLALVLQEVIRLGPAVRP